MGRKPRTLKLSRETLRTLSRETLAQAAGADLAFTVYNCRVSLDCTGSVWTNCCQTFDAWCKIKL
jgi:hypothetical protein